MNNYCIILAGGVGRRLWPCSTVERPKQFMDFFGTGRTLLQMTYDRYCRIVAPDHIYISTHQDYVELVRQQLPDVPAENIVAETTRLSTAPAAAQASQRIAERDANACVVAAPADQIIIGEDIFCHEVHEALECMHNMATECFLALAVPATHPYTSYGYIQKGENLLPDIYQVKTFTEKPDRPFAEMFIHSDEFLWNTGLFMWHVKTMQRLATDILEEVMVQKLDSLLLDRHREDVLVLQCSFGWTDIGCWPRMHEVSHKDVDGNATLGSQRVLLEGCSDNTIAVEPGTEVIVKGLTGYLVAYHQGRLVIMPNEGTAELKRLQTRLQGQ